MIVINCVCFDEVQFDVEVFQFQQWCDVLVGAVLIGGLAVQKLKITNNVWQNDILYYESDIL